MMGLPDLAERHDVFLVDQFGVLHDGVRAFPGAANALAKLKATGATIVLLSNSGRPAAPNADRLTRLGFAPKSYDRLQTSGDIAREKLAEAAPVNGNAMPRCLLLSRSNDTSPVDGLGIELVRSASDADIVLIGGSHSEDHDIDYYETLLRPAAERGVPAICSNPDKIMMTEIGLRYGPGAVAERYAAMGGPVTWIGKPFPEMYRAALHDLGDPAPDRVCCIGDSIEHDIAGGAGAGLKTALVRTGILANEDAANLAALFDRYGAWPDYVIPAFVWDK